MGVQGFGKPKYNAGGRDWEIFKLVISKTDDMADNIYRIIPPIHACADSGTWQYYTGTHYGYAGVNPQDPSKPRTRPFRCIEQKDMRTKMITVVCPECEKAARLKAKLEEIKAALAAQGKSEKEIKIEVQAFEKEVKSHECNRKWNSWAIAQDGKIGLLSYSHTLKKKLDELRKKLEKKGIDMLDPDGGVWINIRRKGMPPSLVEEIEELKESRVDADGDVVEKPKKAPISQEQANSILTMLEKYDLRDQGGVVLSASQIQQLADCNGDPEEVDRIFNQSQPASTSSKPAPTSNPTPAPASQPSAPVVPPVPPTPAPEQPAPSPVLPPPAPPAPVTPPPAAPAAGSDAAKMAALQEQLALLQAQIAAQTKVAPAPASTPAPAANAAPAAAPAATATPAQAPAVVPTTPPTPAPTSQLSDDAFLAMFPQNGNGS